MRALARFTTRLSLVALVAICVGAPAASWGQGDAPKQPTKEDLEKAKVLVGEAAAAEGNGELTTAIEKYSQAYELFPDPNLLIKLGDAYRKNAQNSDAIKTWKKYIETSNSLCGKYEEETCSKIEKQNGACVAKFGEPPADAEGEEPKGAFEACVGRYGGPVGERVSAVEKELVEKVEKDKEEAARIAAEAEKKRKADEEAKKKEADKLPLGVSAVVMAGADQRATVIGRLMAGGMLRIGKFAPEAHIAFEGFLRANNDKGTQAQSFTLLDLGARYSFGDEKFAGLFVTGGGGFGLFLGTPREINLDGDAVSCAGQPGNMCTVQVDKHLNGRFGFGYGFRSGEKATVAVRVDYTAWWYSVDTEQDGVPASQIELPQVAHAFTIGLEFMRWR